MSDRRRRCRRSAPAMLSPSKQEQCQDHGQGTARRLDDHLGRIHDMCHFVTDSLPGAVRLPRERFAMNFGCRHRLTALAVVAFASSGAAAAHGKVLSQWVEVGPDGTSSVRAITDEACPSVLFDGTPTPMAVRSEPDQKFDNVKPAEFKVRGCELAVPPEAIAGVLDGKTLPLVRPNPQRILMFGDTGCQAPAAGNAFQDCNDPVAWPFSAFPLPPSRRRRAPRSRDPCGRLSLSRGIRMPGRRIPRLRREPVGLRLGLVECGLLRAGGAAPGGRAVDHGARQSRGLQPRRRGLVSFHGPRAVREELSRFHRRLRRPPRRFRRRRCR